VTNTPSSGRVTSTVGGVASTGAPVVLDDPSPPELSTAPVVSPLLLLLLPTVAAPVVSPVLPGSPVLPVVLLSEPVAESGPELPVDADTPPVPSVVELVGAPVVGASPVLPDEPTPPLPSVAESLSAGLPG
jgi:hypothetical protein